MADVAHPNKQTSKEGKLLKVESDSKNFERPEFLRAFIGFIISMVHHRDQQIHQNERRRADATDGDNFKQPKFDTSH